MHKIQDNLRINSDKNVFSKSCDLTEKGQVLFQHLLAKKENSEKPLHAEKDKSLLQFIIITQ